ncbi:MAG: NYN domain-containing protein [Gammaproteobacteria bacterium]|nr:NYN domain-containing protein [Gammaproteobacteria bacterium]
MKKACIYIDGFNLYYGLRSRGWARYYWLDMENLARSFIDPGAEILARVKYFTSWVKGDRESQNRQMMFIKALEAHCPSLEIHYGRFLAKQRQCRKCGRVHDFYEEKKTDVNIACHMLTDAFHRKHDRVYIVSGDGDLVPAVNMMKKLDSHPRIVIANPPKRKSEELCRAADASFSIKEKNLRLSQLPDTVKSKKGVELTRPAQWTKRAGAS